MGNFKHDEHSECKHSKAFLAEIIALYKSQPALWKMKSKEYHDRKLKSRGYQVIIDKYKEAGEVMDRELVAKKINSLRSCYRKERKKVIESIAQGDEYIPKLWYYPLLQFLDNDNENENDEISNPPSPENVEIKFFDESSNADAAENVTTDSMYSTESTHSTKPSKRPCNDPFEVANISDSQGDLTRFDYAAKSWAITLNLLPEDQQLFATRVINEVLFQAQMGNLMSTTKLSNLMENTLKNRKNEY